jgi:hypothetical protein
MIRSAADRRRNGIDRANQSAKIFMQSLPPSIRNEGVAVFGGVYDMKMQAQMRGWHICEILGEESKIGNSELMPEVFGGTTDY